MLILGNYFLKTANQLCTNNEVIDNLDECKLATGKLNLTLYFNPIGSWSNYPKGCWKWTYRNERWNRTYGRTEAYWNTHSSGSANAEAQAICKAGDWFGLITTNLLYA